MLVLSSSCSHFIMDKQEKYLEEALEMAGDNRGELEKVLNHYSDEPERLKAAQWLISNMPLHHTKSGRNLQSIVVIMKSRPIRLSTPRR